MQANKLQKISIIVRSLWITIVISLIVIFVAFFSKNSRAKLDKLIRHWSARLLKIIKLTYNVYNTERIKYNKNQPYIIISNHGSHYDIPLIFVTLPGSIRMMAKKELFQVPIWGNAMRAAEFISIDRKNPRQAVLDLQNAKIKMMSGIIPWIAPEGTRTRTGKLNEFKKGAFLLAIKTGAIIIPVAIRNSFQILPPKTWDFQMGKHIDIFVMDMIAAGKYTSRDIDKLMQNVRNSIEKQLY